MLHDVGSVVEDVHGHVRPPDLLGHRDVDAVVPSHNLLELPQNGRLLLLKLNPSLHVPLHVVEAMLGPVELRLLLEQEVGVEAELHLHAAVGHVADAEDLGRHALLLAGLLLHGLGLVRHRGDHARQAVHAHGPPASAAPLRDVDVRGLECLADAGEDVGVGEHRRAAAHPAPGVAPGEAHLADHGQLHLQRQAAHGGAGWGAPAAHELQAPLGERLIGERVHDACAAADRARDVAVVVADVRGHALEPVVVDVRGRAHPRWASGLARILRPELREVLADVLSAHISGGVGEVVAADAALLRLESQAVEALRGDVVVGGVGPLTE
mmetsp:Transcript_63072/g.184995  ORF Transcript_63072/g.184995 Transcript_63072/m.184995 type:complete len:325 (-) Transcript_63072:1185-2159(-)